MKERAENRVVEHGKGGEGVGELYLCSPLALDSFLPKFLLQHYDIAVTHLYEERIPVSAAYRVRCNGILYEPSCGEGQVGG